MKNKNFKKMSTRTVTAVMAATIMMSTFASTAQAAELSPKICTEASSGEDTTAVYTADEQTMADANNEEFAEEQNEDAADLQEEDVSDAEAEEEETSDAEAEEEMSFGTEAEETEEESVGDEGTASSEISEKENSGESAQKDAEKKDDSKQADLFDEEDPYNGYAVRRDDVPSDKEESSKDAPISIDDLANHRKAFPQGNPNQKTIPEIENNDTVQEIQNGTENKNATENKNDTGNKTVPENQDKRDLANEVSEAQKRAQADEDKRRYDREKARESAINNNGETLTKDLIKACQDESTSTDEKIGIATRSIVNFLNKSLIKTIPYGGGALSALTDAFVNGTDGKPDATLQKLDTISNQLEQIKEAIKKAADQMGDKANQIMAQKTIDKINDSYNRLRKYYEKKAGIIATSLNTIADENAPASKVEEAVKIITVGKPGNDKTGEKPIYGVYCAESETMAEDLNSDSFLGAYMNFANAITAAGNLIKNYSAADLNVFNAYDRVKGENKTGKYSLQEFQQERENFVNTIKSNTEYGYKVLYSTMTLEKNYNENLKSSYDAAAKKLKEELKNMDPNSYAYRSANKMIDELGKKSQVLATLINTTDGRIRCLIDAKNSVDVMCDTRIKDLDKEKAEYEAARPSMTQNKVVLSEDRLEFEKMTIKGIDAYPSYNQKDSLIEYRDQYGELMATQTIAKDYKKIATHEAKKDKVYRMNLYGPLGYFYKEGDNIFIKLDKIYQEKGFLFNEDYAEGHDPFGLEWGMKFSVGTLGNYCIYEKKVGDLNIVSKYK